MTIQEAIKSGKRFRRPGTQWLYSKAIGDITLHFNKTDQPVVGTYGICIDELFAGDWEIEEEAIEITRSQLESVLKRNGIGGRLLWYPIFRDLGFKS